MEKTFADQVIAFHLKLQPDVVLPEGVDWINPFEQQATISSFSKFFNKYYGDTNKRIFLFGINPGRFGAGITGVPFTDPIRLENSCGIENDYQKRQELSSVFIYELIDQLGGVKKFYSEYYITSLSPLGFIKQGKNYNYYDDKILWKNVEPFIIKNIETQIEFGARKVVAFSLGKGKNFTYLKKLNDQYQFFEKVLPLPHPRWVMQYRLKRKNEFLSEIVNLLTNR
jgi:hypothetical protein